MKENQPQHFSIKVADTDRYDEIYRAQVGILKVKSIRKCPEHVENIPRVPLTLPIEKYNKNISILMDYIFIKGQPYFLTKSAKINFHYI